MKFCRRQSTKQQSSLRAFSWATEVDGDIFLEHEKQPKKNNIKWFLTAGSAKSTKAPRSKTDLKGCYLHVRGVHRHFKQFFCRVSTVTTLALKFCESELFSNKCDILDFGASGHFFLSLIQNDKSRILRGLWHLTQLSIGIVMSR